VYFFGFVHAALAAFVAIRYAVSFDDTLVRLWMLQTVVAWLIHMLLIEPVRVLVAQEWSRVRARRESMRITVGLDETVSAWTEQDLSSGTFGSLTSSARRRQQLPAERDVRFDRDVMARSGCGQVTFVHSSDFDRNGVFNYFGTSGGLHAYRNPTAHGVVNVHHSDLPGSLAEGDATTIVGREPWRADCLTQDVANSWIQVNLPEHRYLCPSQYSIRHGYYSRSHALRTWVLQGSVDGSSWEDMF